MIPQANKNNLKYTEKYLQFSSLSHRLTAQLQLLCFTQGTVCENAHSNRNIENTAIRVEQIE